MRLAIIALFDVEIESLILVSISSLYWYQRIRKSIDNISQKVLADTVVA